MKHFWNLIDDAGVTVINVDAEITAEDWFDDGSEACARNFRSALAKAGDVTIRINSQGGDVFAASDMYAAMMDHSGEITVEVTGIAASAASVIAMAGDTVRMAPTATMMIHNPWTFAAGSAKDLRHEAKVLDEIREGLINAYEIKTGLSRDKLKSMLDAETWLSARTAKSLGFCDEIIGDTEAEENEEATTDQKITRLLQTMNSFSRAYVAKLISDKAEGDEDEEEDTTETEEPKEPETEETEETETEEEAPETGEEEEDPDEDTKAAAEEEERKKECERREALTAHAQAALERVARIMGRR